MVNQYNSLLVKARRRVNAVENKDKRRESVVTSDNAWQRCKYYFNQVLFHAIPDPDRLVIKALGKFDIIIIMLVLVMKVNVGHE